MVKSNKSKSETICENCITLIGARQKEANLTKIFRVGEEFCIIKKFPCSDKLQKVNFFFHTSILCTFIFTEYEQPILFY